MKHAAIAHWMAIWIAAGLAGCTALPPATPPPTVYLLDGFSTPAARRSTATGPAESTRPTLVLASIQSAAGFDTHRMVYTLGAHRLAAFARNEWADTPARMLDTVVLRALQEAQTGWTLVPDSSAATGSARLELRQLQLLQDFSTQPSTVTLSLRASLVRSADKQVLATRGFDLREPAASDDPAGGVAAATRAAQALTAELASWCRSSLAP